MAKSPCKYILKQEGVPEKDWPVFKSKEALATHLNKTPTLQTAIENRLPDTGNTIETPVDQSGEVNEMITDPLSDFKQIVNESSSPEEAFQKVSEIKGVPPETAQLFRETYDPDGTKSQQEAFETFYNEVKSQPNEAEKTEVTATTEGGENMREVGQTSMEGASSESNEIFSATDSAIEQSGIAATEARRKLKETFGKEKIEKAVKITREFEKIITRLEKEGIVKKQC